MNQLRYILEKGSKKHHCPNCNKLRFVKYIDVETKNYLPSAYGRCDRESKCTYHLNPYKDGYSKMIWEQENGTKSNWKPKQQKKIASPKIENVFIPIEVLNQTLNGYDTNVFIQNLLTRIDFPFEVEDIESVVALYHLGTVKNGYRSGAITFPFIDVNSNIRAIQVKEFDELNHTKSTDFLHSIIDKHYSKNKRPLPNWLSKYQAQDKRVTCLFGEHLLNKYPLNPIALVEAPKTAIYGSLYFGEPKQTQNFIWLAVYNLSSLNVDKCNALKGRNVYLFPDLSQDGKAFELWSNKAKEIESQLENTSFQVSDLLEQLAPSEDKKQGKDLADYLINKDWRLFRKDHQEVEVISYSFTEPIESEQAPDWSTDVNELENYFSELKQTNTSIQLNSCTAIKNISKFIESHLATIKANNGKNTFLPYLNRLKELKQVITLNQI